MFTGETVWTAETATELGWEHREAAAEHLLVRARLDGVLAPPLRAVVRALGWTLWAGVPAGTCGFIDYEHHKIFIPDRGDRATDNRSIRHELGHLAAQLAYVSHTESDADAIGGAVAVPRRSARRAAMESGWDASRVVATFPDADPVEALMRVAFHADGALAVYAGGYRKHAMVGDQASTGLFPEENELLRRMRGMRRPRPVGSRGSLRGWPIETPQGVVFAFLAPRECVEGS